MKESIERCLIEFYKTTPIGQRIGNGIIRSSSFDRPGPIQSLYRKKIDRDRSKYAVKPDIVKLESTNRCNAQCIHCPQDKLKRPRGVMSYDLFVQIARQTRSLGVDKLQLSYFGEPLLDSRIIDKIRYAKELGFSHVRIYSNGSLLNRDMAGKIIVSGLDVLNISIDGLDTEQYETVRTPLSYDTIVNNIAMMMDLKQKCGASHPKVVINHVAQKETPAQTASFLRRWRARADEVKIHTEHNWGGHIADPTSMRKRPCSVPWYQMIIHWNGKVGLCCQDALGTVTLGDITRETVGQAWKNAYRERIRTLHLEKNFAATGVCHTCDFVSNWL